MATTSMFVEILVIGSIAEIWIALIFLSLVDINTVLSSSVVTLAEKFSTLLLFPLLALTYAIGWVINFLAERLFKPYFQTKFRDQVFKGAGAKYTEARSIVVQHASEEVINEMEFDRHILRIARGSVLNFLMIAIILLLYLGENSPLVITGIGVSLGIAIVSFFQWLSRYQHSYSRILDAYKAINSKVESHNKGRK
ncbi:MAG TPA: hypothetical protein VK206_03830 [Anaerolineales bacterium]|nr:hypothetical protein [Anaerolineales bacterium]